MMICRTTFTPPLVEPAEPPVKNKAKKIPVAKKLHMVKSAVTKPVVVVTEVTINKACRIALSASPYTFGCAIVVCKLGS